MAIQITTYKYSLIGARTASNFARISGPIFVRNLDCTEDSENVFRDCIVEHDLGLADCTHEQDAGVHCEGVALCTIFIHLCILYVHTHSIHTYNNYTIEVHYECLYETTYMLTLILMIK